MKKLRILGLVAVGLLAGSPFANAALIVDTGQPPPKFTGPLWSVADNQSLASEFSTVESWRITSIQFFMLDLNFRRENFYTVALYADGGMVPGSEIFSEAFSSSSAAEYWGGIDGVSLSLRPGTYWVALEVRNGQNGAAGLLSPSPNPLSYSAYNNGIYGDDWVALDRDAIPFDLGVRILGVAPTSLPEPGSLTLLGLGLAGLGVSRRRRA